MEFGKLKKPLQTIDLQGLLRSDSAGIRTQDPYIKSVLLYRLSYGINCFLKKRCKDKSVFDKKVHVEENFFSCGFNSRPKVDDCLEHAGKKVFTILSTGLRLCYL